MQQISQFSNPYRDCDVVRDASMFFGRKYEMQALYSWLADHRSVSLVGKRHSGKSSLLKFLASPEFQQHSGYQLQRHLFILTDWRDYINKPRDDFFRRVCEQVIRQSASVLELEPLPDLPGQERFRTLLERIQKSGFHPVLLMDSFDRVTSNVEFDPQFFTFLRSLAGINELISYVTATLKPLAQVCHSAIFDSPFFNIFLECKVGSLTPEEARELVTMPAQRAGLPFTSAEADWLLKLGGLHPFFLQVACRHFFEAKRQHTQEPVMREIVERAISAELQPHFEAIWQDLGESERKQLTTEVFQEMQFRHLHLELSSSLLFCRKVKVRNMSQHEPVELFPEDVKSALDHLSDTDFLGKSKLSRLQCVSLQTESGGPISANKQGWRVRELLKRAFEKMKPGDLRNDTAQEWRLYNILWYHYFKYKLPNHNTAARLSISLRQFYREQDKAIEALRKEVLAIEDETLRLSE